MASGATPDVGKGAAADASPSPEKASPAAEGQGGPGDGGPGRANAGPRHVPEALRRPIAVVCDGHRLVLAPLDDVHGFAARAEGSFFQMLLDEEANELRDETGALVIKDLPQVQDVLSMVQDVCQYLTRGWQPSHETIERYSEWRHACHYMSLAVPDLLADVRATLANRQGYAAEALQSRPLTMIPERPLPGAVAFATHWYLVVLSTDGGGLSPIAYRLNCRAACALRAAKSGFDQVCSAGGLRLRAEDCEPALEVQLEPASGSLKLRLLTEALWYQIGGHACLRHKRIVALKARRGREVVKGDNVFQVLELYLHVSPDGLQGGDVCVATWPSFWCCVHVARQRAAKCQTWGSWNATYKVCSGAVFLMQDGLLVQIVAQPQSLRKCYMLVRGAELEHEVRIPLVAPVPFCRQHVRGGKGKGSYPVKGAGPSLLRGQKYYKQLVPAYDTPTPEEAARNPDGSRMQQVWVVRRRGEAGRTPQLVVLLHAADGRVAVAQLSGENGCVPPLYDRRDGALCCQWGPENTAEAKTSAIWGARMRSRWAPGVMDGPLMEYNIDGIGEYRRKYDVPKCHEVMAVTLEDSGRIVIMHRPQKGGRPQLWMVSPPSRAGLHRARIPSCFFRVNISEMTGKGRGKGLIESISGSWHDDRWGTDNARQAVLPDDVIGRDGLEGTAGGASAEGVARVDAEGDAEGDEGAAWPLFAPFTLPGAGSPDLETLRVCGGTATLPIGRRRRADAEPAHQGPQAQAPRRAAGATPLGAQGRPDAETRPRRRKEHARSTYIREKAAFEAAVKGKGNLACLGKGGGDYDRWRQGGAPDVRPRRPPPAGWEIDGKEHFICNQPAIPE